MAITSSEPSYHGVAKLIVCPKFNERIPGIENVLSIIAVAIDGSRTGIATIHGHSPSTRLVEIEASAEYHTSFTIGDDEVLP